MSRRLPRQRRPFGGVLPASLVGRNHPALHRPVVLVDPLDAHVRRIGAVLEETLRRQPPRALAVAAPQIGHSLNLVAFRTEDGGLAVVANLAVAPRDRRDDWVEEPEGCLSLPGRWYLVPRPPKVLAAGTVISGTDGADTQKWREEGLRARLFSHEVDHLDGLLISGWPEVRGVGAVSVG